MRKTIALLLFLSMAWGEKDPEITPERVVQAVENFLRGKITNPKFPDGVTIRVIPASPEETRRGKLKLVEIFASPARVDGVFLYSFRGRAEEPVIDVPILLKKGKLRTLSVKESVVEGVLDAHSLEQIFARGKETRRMKIRVRIGKEGKIFLTGVLTLLRIKNPFWAICWPEPRRDGLYIRIGELRLNGIPAPTFIRTKLEKWMNPIVTPSALPFNPQIRFIFIREGLIYVTTNPLGGDGRKQKGGRKDGRRETGSGSVP